MLKTLQRTALALLGFVGGVLDARSRFIYENATASDRAYARGLAIERRAAK